MAGPSGISFPSQRRKPSGTWADIRVSRAAESRRWLAGRRLFGYPRPEREQQGRSGPPQWRRHGPRHAEGASQLGTSYTNAARLAIRIEAPEDACDVETSTRAGLIVQGPHVGRTGQRPAEGLLGRRRREPRDRKESARIGRLGGPSTRITCIIRIAAASAAVSRRRGVGPRSGTVRRGTEDNTTTIAATISPGGVLYAATEDGGANKYTRILRDADGNNTAGNWDYSAGNGIFQTARLWRDMRTGPFGPSIYSGTASESRQVVREPHDK